MSELAQLRRKTVDSLLRTWRGVTGGARLVLVNKVRENLPQDDLPYLKKQMMLCVDSPGGEVTARAHAAELGRTYLGLNEEGRAQFLRLLANDFGVDTEKLTALSQNYAASEDKAQVELEMRKTLTTPRSLILKQFTALPDGFKFLVNMRADLLPLVAKDKSLKGLEFDLKEILCSWFDIGLLDLVEITWNSPAALLEKLIEYEAVHRVNSWDDLKNRLDSDRRVFAFLHNKMPLEPLIFVHVALVSGMSDNIQQLLDEQTPVFDTDKADTAIFYSISNAQKGLAGIPFGNFLIKRVVSLLTEQMPHIKNFATLSPVPGFRAWLGPALEKDKDEILETKEQAALQKLSKDGLTSLLEEKWYENAEKSAVLKPILLRLCAHYLIHEKKNGRPLDPVANFHLFNGARLERMNWLGDISPKGMKQSAGLMVNYYYKLSEIDDNHEEFVTHGKIVASRQVKSYVE